MKSISVSDYLHSLIMDRKDSAHKSADEVVLGIIAQNDELLRTVDQYDRNKAKEINTRE